jgi:hypothetical protein
VIEAKGKAPPTNAPSDAIDAFRRLQGKVRTPQKGSVMGFFDFIIDLLWGASEVYLGREDEQKSGGRVETSNGHDCLAQNERKELEREQSNRDAVARAVGNKTV